MKYDGRQSDTIRRFRCAINPFEHVQAQRGQIPQQAPHRQTTHAICVLAQREVYCKVTLTVKTINDENNKPLCHQTNPAKKTNCVSGDYVQRD